MPFAVITAGSPKEALGVIDDPGQKLSALFLDINLKDEMTGFEVARIARGGRPGIAVLYTSGGQPTDFQSLRVPGGRFIDKPYRYAEVIQILRGMVNERAAA